MRSRIKHWEIWKHFGPLEWLFLVIGILTIIIFFLSIFTFFGDQTPSPTLTATSTLGSFDFDQALSGTINSYVGPGSPVTILTNGQEFLPDLLAEIKNAQSSITMTNYIWDDGEFGNTLFKALIKKPQEGVAVRVLLDGGGSHNVSDIYVNELIAAGGKVAFFRPIRWWNINRINRRTHIRDIVIDGKVAYIGGIAFSDDWLGNATSSTSWHDFMFKMNGEMALSLQKLFANLWSLTTGEILAGPSFYPPSTRSASPTRYVLLFSQPSPDMFTDMEHFLWLSINSAEKSIYIENPYLLPDPDILKALEEKARAGVDVKILVPGPFTDQWLIKFASQSFYNELLASGVKIYEYQQARIHSKIMIIDGQWSIIGSANLDNRSSQLNLENVMGINDPDLASRLTDKFHQDTAVSKEVTLNNWKPLSYIHLPLEYFARIFTKQF